jgi:hypothetical protein
MTSNVRDTLERGAAPPRRPIDLDGLANESSTRRRRRRIGTVGVAAAAVVMVVVAVVLFRPSSGHDIHTPPASRTGHAVTNIENGVGWTIPDTWQASTLVGGEVVHGDAGPGTADLSAVEMLAAGTTARPAGLGGVLCGEAPPAPTQAFLSVREYPDGPQPGMQPRPTPISSADAAPTTLAFCSSTPGVQVLRIAFVEHRRGFLVYLVIGSQASPATQTEAWDILNSLNVASLATPSPREATQITDAFQAAVTSSDPVASAAIDQADRLPTGVRDQITKLGNTGNYKIEVRDITVNGELARVRYRLGTNGTDLSSDASALTSGYGYAIQRDSTWKVTLDTACQWVQTLGLACPASTASSGIATPTT